MFLFLTSNHKGLLVLIVMYSGLRFCYVFGSFNDFNALVVSN